MNQEQEAGRHSILKMCTSLGVSRSSYYRHLNLIVSKRKRADQLLDQRVLRLYQENQGIYGAGKLRYLLASSYHEYPDISIKRVQKSMRRQNLRSITVKKFKAGRPTKRILKTYKNLLNQDFSTTGLNQKWVADITYIYTLADGWCYLSTIIDLHSRKIIGYHFDRTMQTSIVLKALDDAFSKRKIEKGLILHTDLGSQYTSIDYETKLKAMNLCHSYSQKGCPYDNAGIESFHALLKKEHVYQRSAYSNFEEAKLQVFSYVQGFYNNRRIHSSLAYLSPNKFEQKISAA
ncbi:IS3 family transposase [Listeria monocytogenes]|uniref:IS3 family transposase n=1 Tax=Listeria monocytogenes TaxID=1639 RepID=UPI00214D32F2|nr:IS3 family transposase [Listeria monocytogenes]